MGIRGWFAAVLVICAATVHAAAPGAWDEPAAALAAQIATILGPGQAHLVLHNISTVSNDQLPGLRKALTQELKAHGITLAGAESANTLRVTVSETERERLLVAEIVEGSTTQVAMVRMRREEAQATAAPGRIVLRREPLLTAQRPVLAVLETGGALIAAEPDAMVLYAHSGEQWREAERVSFAQRRAVGRDPRGVVVASAEGFEARVGGVRCEGPLHAEGDAWPVRCAESDDPWPVGGGGALKAFFNPARSWFTGVVTPGVGMDLPAFYAAALLPRVAGNGALLVGGVDGKVQIAENNTLKNVSGARDWGSDFAALGSGCGAGTQVVASGSGSAANDSLRAYEIPALEAVAASEPLAVGGDVMTLETAPDGKSVYAVVRDAEDRYEVDRVTALCN